MLYSWPRTRRRSFPRLPDGWQFACLLAVVLTCTSSHAADELWVENPLELSIAVAKMTENAKALGLTNAAVAASLSHRLKEAGLKPTPTELEYDDNVLFVDIIVEEETFYASLGFWRMASFRLPDGEQNTEMVTVWQEFSVGVHHDDPGIVRSTVDRIIERFIASYSDANDVGTPKRIVATD